MLKRISRLLRRMLMLRGRLVWGSFEAPPTEEALSRRIASPMSSTLIAGTTTGVGKQQPWRGGRNPVGEIVAHTLSGMDDKPLGTSRKRAKRAAEVADKPPI